MSQYKPLYWDNALYKYNANRYQNKCKWTGKTLVLLCGVFSIFKPPVIHSFNQQWSNSYSVNNTHDKLSRPTGSFGCGQEESKVYRIDSKHTNHHEEAQYSSATSHWVGNKEVKEQKETAQKSNTCHHGNSNRPDRPLILLQIVVVIQKVVSWFNVSQVFRLYLKYKLKIYNLMNYFDNIFTLRLPTYCAILI